MAWPSATFMDWKHFLHFASHLTVGSPAQVSYAFRGQADAKWSLQPSLLRHLKPGVSPEEALRVEDRLLRSFQSQAHLHIGPSLVNLTSLLFDWWALMQHHGAPTRLLDWTASPFVAAYFAVEQLWDRDGAIWFVHVKDLRNQMVTQFGDVYQKQEPALSSYFRDPKAQASLQPWFPRRMSERMLAQQGFFLMSPQVIADHEVMIDDACHGVAASGDVYQKVVVPRTVKPDFLRMLRSMNIAASSLFPGIDGLGRMLTELARLETYFPET